MTRTLTFWRVMALGMVLTIVAYAAPTTAFGSAQPPVPPAVTPTPPAVTPTPTPSVPAPSCRGAAACSRAVLSMINHIRVHHHLPALVLASSQTAGNVRCVGSYGHSKAMARTGELWHVNAQFPRASFPRNICLPYRMAGENVGVLEGGSVLQNLRSLTHLMMQEHHSRAECASAINHACTILTGAYRLIGIGVYVRKGVTWLTEDFIAQWLH